MATASESISGSTWTEIASFERNSAPRSYAVSNLSTSGGNVQILAPALAGHAEGASATADDGITLEPGQSIDLTAPDGRITSVWARSAGASISHGATA